MIKLLDKSLLVEILSSWFSSRLVREQVKIDRGDMAIPKLWLNLYYQVLGPNILVWQIGRPQADRMARDWMARGRQDLLHGSTLSREKRDPLFQVSLSASASHVLPDVSLDGRLVLARVSQAYGHKSVLAFLLENGPASFWRISNNSTIRVTT